MKRLIGVLFLLIMLVGCVPSKEADIITTMFVQYDISKQIVKDKMSVSLLITPGAEVHGYQPSSRDIEAIKRAKLFLYTSLELDTWIKNPTALGGEDTVIVDLSKEYRLAPHEHGEQDHDKLSTPLSYSTLIEDGHDHDHEELHYWTDATNVMQLIDAIAGYIIEIDPENEEFYLENADIYKKEVEQVHIDLDEYFGHTNQGKTIYFAGHNAMSGFANRYHIEIISLQGSYQPDADITSVQIQEMIKQIKTAKTHYLFIEELKEPRVANTIKAQLNKEGFELTLLELHGYHNVTKDQLEGGVSYVELMRQNFINIKEALNGSI